MAFSTTSGASVVELDGERAGCVAGRTDESDDLCVDDGDKSAPYFGVD